MARTAVTPTALTPNAGVARPAGTTIDATLVTNGVEVTGGHLEELVVEVSNTSGAERDVTVSAGTNPPADAAGRGALVVPVAATTGVQLIGPFESARFVQAGADAGSLYLDFETGFTGTLRVYHLPHTA
jgi:hypothetical protein